MANDPALFVEAWCWEDSLQLFGCKVTLAFLENFGALQPRALRFLKTVDSLVSITNYYIELVLDGSCHV